MTYLQKLKLDPTKMKDWEIAEIAEEGMPTPDEWREKLGLQKDEIIPMKGTWKHSGSFPRKNTGVDYQSVANTVHGKHGQGPSARV